MGTRNANHVLIRHSAATFGTTALIVLIRMAKNGVISRILGPSMRGVFGLLMLIPEMLASFGDLGFGPSLIYHIAKRKSDLRSTFGAMLVFSFVLGVLLALCGWGILALDMDLNEEIALVKDYRALIVFAIPLMLFTNLGVSILIGKNRIYTLNAIWLLQSLLPFLLFLLLWTLMPASPLNAAASSWFAGVVCVAISPLLFLIKESAYPPTYDPHFMGAALRYGFSGYFANVFIQALRRVDFLFIAAMLDAKALGLYAIATAMAEMLLLLPESIALPFVPLVFGMKKDDSERFTPLVLRSVLFVMLLGCVGMAVLGKFVLLVIFGSEFLPAVPAMLALLPGVLGLAVFPILKAHLFGRNKPGIVSLLTGVAILVNLPLNYFTIPKWGIVGAAASSSICYLLAVALLYIFYCRTTGFPMLGTLFFSHRELRSAIQRLFRKRK